MSSQHGLGSLLAHGVAVVGSPLRKLQVISMPLSDTIKTLIRNAWDDGYPCLLATSGPQGPNITPKGSMIVFDD